MLISFFPTITEPFPQPRNLLNQRASKNELLDDNYHLGYVSDILLISTYCWMSSEGDGASVLAFVVSFILIVQRGKMRLSFYLCNAVCALDWQGFLVCPPNRHDFCFCCYWSCTTVFTKRKKLRSKMYLDNRKSKVSYSKPFFFLHQ